MLLALVAGSPAARLGCPKPAATEKSPVSRISEAVGETLDRIDAARGTRLLRRGSPSREARDLVRTPPCMTFGASYSWRCAQPRFSRDAPRALPRGDGASVGGNHDGIDGISKDELATGDHAPKGPMSTTSTPRIQSYTVLIVDDTPTNLAVAIHYLEEHGFSVSIAQDGKGALEMAELVRPDLILLDVLMPGMDGFETCRRLKASESVKQVPVIFITALTETTDKITGFEAGGVDYVTKPVDLGELIARVRTHVTMHTMHQQIEAQRQQLEAQNARLQQENAMREEIAGSLRLAREELELRVAVRTAELAEANATLREGIAERKEVETALRESQDLLQAIIDNSTAVIYVKDLEGRYLLVNRRFQDLFHGPKASFLGKTDYDIFPPTSAEAFCTFDRRVLEANKPLEAEETAPLADGVHTFISLKGPLFDAIGKPYAVYGISADITERKRAEEEREALLASEQAARSRAEAADRLKDEFLATLSHELRTPLTAICGWTHLLRSGRLDTAAVQRGIDVIERNSLAELQIVEQLLDISASIHGKMQLKAEPIDLGPLIQSAVDSVKLAAETKGIFFSLSLAATTRKIWGDRNRLQQVVWNLLHNAIKFTPGGGRVAVSLQEIGPMARIRISDTGQGISAEFLPHVFEQFRQADSSIGRRHGGLGLGLSIVRNLVEMHGGTARGESGGVGRGATFTVDLPLLPDVEVAAAAPSASPRNAGIGSASSVLAGLRVLVVEDDLDVGELITSIMAALGAVVRVATAAQEGFEIFVQWRPDVVVSDIGLPGEDGYALIRRIRALPVDRGGQTPAAALTAYVGEDARERALSAGYQVHVPKPFDPDALVAVITKLMSGGGPIMAFP